MEKLIFVTETAKKEGNYVRVTGVAKGSFPEAGSEVEILSHSGNSALAEVVEAGLVSDSSIHIMGEEQAAYFLLSNVSDEIEMYDVISPLADKPEKEQETSKGKAVMDNRRLTALIWKYAQEKKEEILGTIFENLANFGKFYIVAQTTGNGDKKNGVKFPTLQTPNKHQYYAAFTSGEELAKSPKLPLSKAVIFDFDDLMVLFHEFPMVTGLVIDPFSINMVLDRKTLAHIRNKKIEQSGAIRQEHVEREEQVAVSAPEKKPEELLQAIEKYAKSDKAIRKLWIRQIKRESQESFSYLLVVELAGDLTHSFSGIAAAARPKLNGVRLEMLPSTDVFAKQVIAGVRAFYEK